jgi:holo-[acyl-carrier protein] synthase
VSVRRGGSGRPRLELRGNALELATKAGANRWHVSISHDHGIAAAVVILEGRAP